jgi:hypothetical protein
MDDGALLDFSINPRSQRILLAAWCPIAGYSTWVTIRAEFEGLVYLTLINDNPIVLSGQNGIDRFEELPQSALKVVIDDLDGVRQLLADNDNALVLDERGGFQFLATNFASHTVAWSHRRFPFRYFVLNSSWLSAKWLCSTATFELVPDPP